MTTIDLRLKYQKEAGYSLDTINLMARDGDPDYVEWLETSLVDMIKAYKRFLEMQPNQSPTHEA